MRLSAEMYDQILKSLKSDSNGTKDKRTEPRVGMAGETDMVTVDANGKRTAGKVRVRDISSTGIGLTFSQELAKDQRFVVQLESSKSEPIWLVCLVAYCKRGVGSYTVGAHIKQMLRSDQINKVEAQSAAAAIARTAAAAVATNSAPAHAIAPAPAPSSHNADIARISRAIIG